MTTRPSPDEELRAALEDEIAAVSKTRRLWSKRARAAETTLAQERDRDIVRGHGDAIAEVTRLTLELAAEREALAVAREQTRMAGEDVEEWRGDYLDLKAVVDHAVRALKIGAQTPAVIEALRLLDPPDEAPAATPPPPPATVAAPSPPAARPFCPVCGHALADADVTNYRTRHLGCSPGPARSGQELKQPHRARGEA